MVADGETEFTCNAVGWAAFGATANYKEESAFVERYMKTFSTRSDGFLTIRQFDETRDPIGIRVLALCFMAAMVEAGDA